MRRWALASQVPLALEYFQNSVRAPPVAWDAAAADEMRRMLAVDHAQLPAKQWQWLRGAINRVVLVVPMYCDGREFYPTPAFAGGLPGAEESER